MESKRALRSSYDCCFCYNCCVVSPMDWFICDRVSNRCYFYIYSTIYSETGLIVGL